MAHEMLFKELAEEFVNTHDHYAKIATEVQKEEMLKQIDIKKIVDEFEKEIPEILRTSIAFIRERVNTNDELSPLLRSFLDKIDPSKIKANFNENREKYPNEKKLYLKCGIEKAEFNAILKVAKELIDVNEIDFARSLFNLLVLLDETHLEAWVGLGESNFLSGENDNTVMSFNYYHQALNAFEKAHFIDPKNSTPIICTIIALIALKEYQKAKNIIHAFNEKKDELNEPTMKALKTLNAIVKSKL